MKFFVLSDIHGFAKEMKYFLKRAGFDKKNKNHTLVVLGDIFDRGPEAIEVYKFLKSIPKKRCILIRGNHESLYFKLLNKSFPDSYDFSNKTVDTFCQITNEEMKDKNRAVSAENLEYEGEQLYYYDDTSTAITDWDRVKHLVANSQITAWLKSAQWKNYAEIGKYIFVHSFIPTNLKQSIIDKFGINAYGFENPDCFEYNKDWRASSDMQWEAATWGCPYAQYTAGLFKSEEDLGKVLVCGHWHTGDFFRALKNNKAYTDDCGPIYYSKGLIGLDGGVLYDRIAKEYIHPQNVLVIDENEVCYDQWGNKLVEEKAIPIIKTVSGKE